MSWWFNRESRGGDRRIVLIDFPWLAPLAIVGMLAALLLPLIARYFP